MNVRGCLLTYRLRARTYVFIYLPTIAGAKEVLIERLQAWMSNQTNDENVPQNNGRGLAEQAHGRMMV